MKPACRPVLVVDDDEDNREMLAIALEQGGFDVAQYPSAEDALAEVGDSRFHLVISDLKLPGMSGIDLVRRLREHPDRRGLRAFALTGVSAHEVRATAPGVFTQIFVKPVDPGVLIAAAAAEG